MDRRQALSKAMALCSQKEYTESGIRGKLKLWGAAEDDIDPVIQELIKEKFIDDLRFATAFVRDKVRLNQWGRVKIRFMLGMEHLKFSIVDQALAEIDEEVYEESLKVILEKKARELARESNAYTKKQKLVKFAQGRGYETDVILKVLKEGEERK